MLWKLRSRRLVRQHHVAYACFEPDEGPQAAHEKIAENQSEKEEADFFEKIDAP